jgi:FtsP/CotA-like multicopper oxidase with cupredoxin domain
MAIRHVYLKIEAVPDYSPVAPDMMAGPPIHYGRDCMRTMGHEDGTVPQSEIDARSLNALIYREYLDPSYLVPKADKIVLADVNEPAYHRRVPGTVIYTHPGERLKIHVLNDDTAPHSLHVHGLRYGIDSDGSWPLGTQASDGRRSDEICPGESWTYTFDVTDEMIGAWPFHDHCHDVGANISRGLFGGIIVVPPGEHERPPHFQLPIDVREYLEELRKPLPELPRLPGEDAAELPAEEADRELALLEPGGPEVRFQRVKISFDEYLHLPDVQPKIKHTDVLHVPLFLHYMSGASKPAFDIGPIARGATVDMVFGAAGTFAYHCSIHQQMRGTVVVAAGEAPDRSVTIDDSDPMNMHFDPATVRVAPGGTVHWHNLNNNEHTVTEDGGGFPSFCFNGRTFLGNTPTIAAVAGQRIRWYVFNLDLGMNWHNFHPHGQRWRFANETYDTRSLGPAESFVVETKAPPVLLLPPAIEQAQEPPHRPHDARPYEVRGDFLFHCHVEMHMMSGLVGLVRSRQTLWLTKAQAKALAKSTGLPLDPGPADNDCPAVDPDRCRSGDCGRWEVVAGSPEVCMMHAVLLPNTNKLLFWGYGDTRDDISRLWDYSSAAGAFSMPANQPFDVTSPPANRGLANLWSAEHAFLNTAEGQVLIHGGFTPRESYRFNPATLAWSRTPPTADQRFYSTTLTLADGKILTLIGGSPSSIPAQTIEVYDPTPGTWQPPIPLPSTFWSTIPDPNVDYLYYPWTYLLPGGDLFIAGPRSVTRRFNWTTTPIIDDPAHRWNTIAGNRSTGGEKGTSVLLPLNAPDYRPRVIIAGGNTNTSKKTAEIIDLGAVSPAWSALPDLNQERAEQVNTVLLPDGRVFLAGGVMGAGGLTELFDPENPAAGWTQCPGMTYSRGYHSSAILLADGSVLMGGDQAGMWKSGETTPHERYFPWYFARTRPGITSAPSSAGYGATISVDTPQAPSILRAVLMRPGAVTHGFNMSQRAVVCAITARGATSIHVQMPPDGTVAPPGWYLLFIVDGGRVPSTARWIRLH